VRSAPTKARSGTLIAYVRNVGRLGTSGVDENTEKQKGDGSDKLLSERWGKGQEERRAERR
jgi:hypothetical protein